MQWRNLNTSTIWILSLIEPCGCTDAWPSFLSSIVCLLCLLLQCKPFRATVLISIRGVLLGYIQQHIPLCCSGTSIVHRIINASNTIR